MHIRFDVNPRWIVWSLLVIIGGLTAADIAIHVLRFGFGRDHIMGLIPFFDFGTERNLPSWFSSTQLALAAVLVTMIAVRKFNARDGQRFMWAILAIGFWYLSLDETVQLHEYWAPNSGGFDITRGLLTFRWVMVGMPVVAAVALLFGRFVFTLPKRTRNAVIGTGVLYVWSALGVEMLQALYLSTYRVKNFAFQMITVAEETGEMLAIALFIFALLRYMQDEDASERGGTARLPWGFDIQISSRVVARTLIAIVTLLVLIASALYVLQFQMGHDHVFGLVKLMDLAREGSLPTWYASTQLAVAGALLLIIAVTGLRDREKHALAWCVLALGFFFMSLAESARIHEAWGRFAAFVPQEGIFYFRWLVVAIPLCVVLFFFFLGLLRSLSPRTRNGTFLSAAIFLGGALGLEMVSSYVADGNKVGADGVALLNIAGNGMELFGIALFISVLLRHMSEERFPLAVRKARTTPAPSMSQPILAPE